MNHVPLETAVAMVSVHRDLTVSPDQTSYCQEAKRGLESEAPPFS